MLYFGAQRGLFSKVVLALQNFRYDFLGVGGYVDYADMCAGIFPLMLIGGRANSQVCGELGHPSA